MKSILRKTISLFLITLIIVACFLPNIIFAKGKETSVHVFFTTSYEVDSVFLELTGRSLEMNKQGGHWMVKDDGIDVGVNLLGVTVNFLVNDEIISQFYPASKLNITPEGSDGEGSINIRMGVIEPEPEEPTQSTLTVKYMLDGTGTEIASADTYTQEEGSTITINAKQINGYTLKSGQSSSYTYTFEDSDFEYIFWYVAVEEPEEPEVTQSTLTVKYMLDGTGTEIASADTYTQDEGSILTVNAKEIEGYELKSGQSSSYTHTFGDTDAEYTFWYLAIEEPEEPEITQSTLTVKYMVDGTGTVLYTETFTQDEGTSIEITAKAFEGYELKEDQAGSYQYTFGDSDFEYIFWYVAVEEPEEPEVTQSTLTVKYMLDGTGTEIASADTYTQEEGSTITINAKQINGYTLKSGQSSSYTHTFDSENGEYIFWYVAVETPGEPLSPGGSTGEPVYYSNLTVYYALAGSDPVEYLRGPDVFNRRSGTSLTITAPEFAGYVLRSQGTYIHTFTLEDATYTFFYDKIVEAEAPQVPLGGAFEGPIGSEGNTEIEVPEQQVPLAEPTPPLNKIPQTGGVAPEIFYAAGLSLISLGSILNKRRSNRK
ncbi:MucBP domain-containing protein [Thermovenabulum gondwanense]|uniref:MucBP domain-containing protein n=1 Tax=Thermovenabulum gondwanense TaxID=520767 RepID=A0A162MEP6_9FIRM|nr:MucBP domain-containing protein [Thermovenabulum gondwanense]KYO65497.1 hypothetical protein ATZ99_15330 [Thermovenabulum gondwanense]